MNKWFRAMLTSPFRVSIVMALIMTLTWAGVFGKSPWWDIYLYFLSPALILFSAIAASILKKRRHALIGLGLVLPGFLVFELFLGFLPRGRPEPSFGSGIKIPANMKVDTVSTDPEFGLNHNDPDAEKILKALTSKQDGAPFTRVKVDLGELELALSDRTTLGSYLAANPKWAVREEFGEFAVRRFVSRKGLWEYQLHGFVSREELAPPFSKIEYFQTRVRLLLNDIAIAKARRAEVTSAKLNDGLVDVAIFDPAPGQPGFRSTLLITDALEKFAIEIYEQSPTRSRIGTIVWLNLLKQELSGGFKNHLEERAGHQALSISGGYGIYKVYGLVNPGEPGWMTLRVFEATKNTPLSAEEVLRRSNERIGWSKTSADKFYYQSEVTIYEGDWGTFYPARFELWFSPDSGGPARKVAERM